MKTGVALIVLVSLITFQACTPSDETLIKRFYPFEKDFDRLAIMALEDDKLTRIAMDFTWLEDNVGWPRPASELGFSVERWDEYRGLFRKLGIWSGIYRQKRRGILFFTVSVSGLVTGGSSKGYALSKSKPSPVLASLDERSEEIKSGEPAFKHIKGNWYVYYRWDD